jgi:TatD DNase family protein
MPNRGALNVPAQVATVIRAMAVERGDDLAEFANALSANAERAFGKFN